jgi:hypothetical protein
VPDGLPATCRTGQAIDSRHCPLLPAFRASMAYPRRRPHKPIGVVPAELQQSSGPRHTLNGGADFDGGNLMSDWEAVPQRAKRRAEEARRRADNLQERYRELAQDSGVSREQLHDAAQAADAAIGNAVAAHEALLEQFERSAIAHDNAARTHDQVATPRHRHAAEVHRAAAHEDRMVAAQLRTAGGRSPLSITESTVRDMRVLTVDGALDATTYMLMREAIVKAARDEPRAVIVDVTKLVVREDPAWAVFTSAVWQVTEWPGKPIALVCAHDRGRNALRCNGITRYVAVYPTVQSAVDEVSAGSPRRYRLRALASLPATKSSSQRCRELTAQWLTAWSRTDFIHAASIVVTELVEMALTDTDSAISLRLETDGSTVSIAVQYVGAGTPGGRHSSGGADVRLNLITATSRVWGSYTAAAGNTIWAALGPENRF